jgi:hypothetical protein
MREKESSFAYASLAYFLLCKHPTNEREQESVLVGVWVLVNDAAGLGVQHADAPIRGRGEENC